MLYRLTAVCLLSLLAGCDIPGLGPDPRIVQREADARAVGGACRHALRGIEDCYALNGKAPKAAVFAGWKDMDQYMRDNKIEGRASAVVVTGSGGGAEAADPEASIDKTADKKGGAGTGLRNKPPAKATPL